MSKGKNSEFDYYLIDKRPKSEGGCWNWTGKIDRDGYGKLRFYNRTFRAHRWVWECIYGYIKPGLQLDHLCKNRRCVNPAHLEAVSQKVNTQRATNHNRDKQFCPQGHKYTELNTYYYINKAGHKRRKCRSCNKDRVAAFREENA